MGQPTPPGENIPLIEGLDSSWNDIVNYIPEDKRAEFGPRLKERISAYEPLKQWEDFQKSGITPEHASTAINLFSLIENDPRQVYEAIGQHLNITPQQAKEAVEEMKETDGDDPRLKTMQQQIDTLSQIAIANRQMSEQERQAAEQDAAIDKEIGDLKKKYGSDVNEREVLLRMLNDNMTAEQAHQEFSQLVTDIRSRRPAPMVMGSGGSIPNRSIDVTKLDSKGTKNLVVQMLEHENAERNK